jgi:hypothetical protein
MVNESGDLRNLDGLFAHRRNWTSDARTALGHSFNHRGGGGVGIGDTSEIELEIGRMRNEGRCAGVLQPAHVGSGQPAFDRDAKYRASAGGTNACHVQGAGNMRAGREAPISAASGDRKKREMRQFARLTRFRQRLSAL